MPKGIFKHPLLTEEHKRKISLTMKGRKMSVEARKKYVSHKGMKYKSKLILCNVCKREFMGKKPSKFCKRCQNIGYRVNNKIRGNTKGKEYFKSFITRLIKNKPDYFNNKIREYNIKNPLKYKVKSFTNQRFKKDKFCNICGSEDNLNFHHFIYRLPVQKKDFSTICRKCHSILHHNKLYKVLNEVQI